MCYQNTILIKYNFFKWLTITCHLYKRKILGGLHYIWYIINNDNKFWREKGNFEKEKAMKNCRVINFHCYSVITLQAQNLYI